MQRLWADDAIGTDALQLFRSQQANISQLQDWPSRLAAAAPIPTALFPDARQTGVGYVPGTGDPLQRCPVAHWAVRYCDGHDDSPRETFTSRSSMMAQLMRLARLAAYAEKRGKARRK